MCVTSEGSNMIRFKDGTSITVEVKPPTGEEKFAAPIYFTVTPANVVEHLVRRMDLLGTPYDSEGEHTMLPLYEKF